ncbi:hypothetical protein CVT24_009777 [Panaeolus cyanescens]|uniref:ZZ-type domain-containing protein n=1 Tax=Panaeolus cyanescens TaxID=181874 RepID=A0A409VEN5_9AGAR|nr:hypothetical protein CVT24_009777 [Panaeolus cyanescens]
MFTIKVTFGAQTRKYNFHIDTFPTYEQITAQYHQLERVFSLRPESFYLSKVLFSPNAAQSSRILVARAIHTASDYNEAIKRLKDRNWPHPLLRFVILLSHSVPILQTSTEKQDRGIESGRQHSTVFHEPPTTSFSFEQNSLDSQDTIMHDDSVTVGHTQDSVVSQNQPDFQTLTAQQSTSSIRTDSSSCCSVAQGKEEIRTMLFEFQNNLKRVMETDLSPSPSATETFDASLSDPPSSKACSICGLLDLLSGWRCGKCNVMICNACQLRDPKRFCLNAMGPHETNPIVLEPFEDRPIPHLPEPWVNRNSTPIQPAAQGTPVVHNGVVCDACNKTIEGVRHKCLDCPDYDLCGPCLATGQAEVHNAFHEFFEIREPGRVIVHTVYTGNGERVARPSNRTAGLERPTTPQPPALTTHFARCDLCDSTITGYRYIMTHAVPVSGKLSTKFKLVCNAQRLYSITAEQHPGHSFIRVRKPEDFITRPIRRGTAKHFASCDYHPWDSLQGVFFVLMSLRLLTSTLRYQCMHPECPDYDLCQDCEALPIPVHPDNHPLLKMKSPETVIPTVYRVGGTEIIPLNSSSTDEKCEPNDVHQPSSSFFDITNEKEAEVPLATPEPPRLPPKPEMISTPSWASIPSFFGASHGSFQDIRPVDRSQSDSPRRSERLWWEMGIPPHDPVATSPPLVSVVPIPPVIVTSPSNPVDSTPKPSGNAPLPMAVINPWPTTNAVERQELLQLIADFGSCNDNAMTGLPVADNGVNKADAKYSTSIPSVHEQESSTPTWPQQNLGQFLTDNSEESVENPVGHESNPESSVLSTPIENHPLLQRPASEPIPATVVANSSLASSLLSEVRSIVLGEKKAEVTETSSPRGFLSAEFLEDVTVEDGCVFPPGAEFVKCWKLLNDGTMAWPASTQLVYVAGETLTQGNVPPSPVNVGSVAAGAETEISTGELKAPEVPGRYVSYWRLQVGDELFGNSLWVEIRVVEADSDSSIASSSVIMPTASSARQSERLPTQRTSSTLSAMDTLSDVGSDDSGSLISMPDSEEEEMWHDIPSHFSGTEAATSPAPAPAMSVPNTGADFVMLYDDRSSSSTSSD